MIWLHALFVVLLVGTEAFFTGLSALNVRYGERTVREESDWVRDVLGVEDVDRLLDYHRLSTGSGLLRSWVSLGAVLVVLYSGLFADGVAAVENLGLGAALGLGPALTTVVDGVVFFLGLVVAVTVLSLPFDAFSTFAVEEAFGFNEQSPKLWVRDQAVQLAISGVLVALLGGAVLWVVATFPTWWWVGAWALFVAFSLAMLVVYPRVIAPLFNDFDPIEGGELREAIEDTFDRAGFECEQVYEMDASRRSSKSNAYFVGFGRTKRVVLYDTLVEQMDRESIQAVLAHELAHWKESHIWKQLAASSLQIGIVLAVLGILVDQPTLYEMFDLESQVPYAGLVLAYLWVEPINRFTSPLSNRLSLEHEREADAFAVDVMGEGDSLVDALTVLTGENLSNPFPHPWYATFHYDHPPVPERIRNIRDRVEGGVDAGSPPESGAGEQGDPA